MFVFRDGEVHKWQLDHSGRRLHKAEYISPRDSDNPFMVMLNAEDIEEVLAAVERLEGCNIYGWLHVHRVAGNIHFSVRPEAMMAVAENPNVLEALMQRHLDLHHDLDHEHSRTLNASHIIHSLHFGPGFPGQVQPLDGVSRIDRKATGIDKYFLKIVPIEYRSLWGWSLQTNQYSVTEYYTPALPESRMLPGVYFLYDTWPIKVKLQAARLGLLHTLVRVCAVCGGVWAVTSLTDKLVHRAVSKARKFVKPSRAP